MLKNGVSVPRVLVAGDVLRRNPGRDRSYLPNLQQELGGHFSISSLSPKPELIGAEELARRLADELVASVPDVVILHLGFCDGLDSTPPIFPRDKVRESFDRIRKCLLKAGVGKVIVVLPPPLEAPQDGKPLLPYDRALLDWNDWLAMTAHFYEFDTVDCAEKFRKWGYEKCQDDHQSFTKTGVKRVARRVARILDRRRKQDAAPPALPADHDADAPSDGISDFFTRKGRVGIHAVAAHLGMDPKSVQERVLRSDLRDAINMFRSYYLKPWELQIEHSQVNDGLTQVRLTNGRVFWGHPTGRMMLRVYRLLTELLPDIVIPEAYRLAIDVASRYRGATSGFKAFLPGAGGVIFEVGAYLGFKAVRFAEIVGPTGKVVSIEAHPSNFDVMVRNIRDNGMESIISAVHCGVWSEPGTMTLKGTDRQSASLVDLDQKQHYQSVCTVPTDTLARIMDRLEIAKVDVMNLQVMGAEVEALRGLGDRLNDVRVFRIVTPFTRDGRSARDDCEKILTQAGARFSKLAIASGLYAVTEPHIDDYAPLLR